MYKNFASFAAVFLILFGFQYLASPAFPILMAPTTKTTLSGEALSHGQIAASGIAMVIGIVFGSFHEALKTAKRGSSAFKLVGGVLIEPGLYRSLLAAPIVFGGVYTATLHSIDPIVALIFAFQNGFFCDSLLRKPSTR